MPRLTFEEHTRAVAAVGVQKVDYDRLVSTRTRVAFERACRASCADFLRANKLSDWPQTYRNQFLGFVSPESQGVWCAWTDALTFAPNMPADSALPSSELFCLEMCARGFRNLTAEDIRAGCIEGDAALRWKAWQAALAFWMNYTKPVN